MRKLAPAFLMAVILAAASLLFAQGRSGQHGFVLVPDSSIEQPGDQGARAHTNHLIHVRPDGTAGPTGQTPAGLVAFYGVTAGGSGTIVIVDAYHYATALSDFNTFASQFNLPVETSNSATRSTNAVFQVMYQNGVKPRSNCGWAQEAALDIEWAHAMAPHAKIVLMEAASNSFSNLLGAVDQAVANVPNLGQLSMSWGGGEFSSEAAYDSHFTSPNVVFFASSGDTGGATIYPGVSPNVVAAGGTHLNSDGTESGWSGSGGGPSKYESRPSFQSVISALVGSQRGVPDFSFDADPYTGVSVYDSTSCQGLSGWLVFGGTSVASPSLAGIVNSVGHASTWGTANELSTIYANLGTSNYASNYFDVTKGTAGSYSAATGWDFVTGVGSPRGMNGK